MKPQNQSPIPSPIPLPPNERGAYSGFYRATVLQRVDPDKQGRIKVKMRQIYGDTAEDDLPWCYPMFGSWPDSSGQYGGAGVGYVPTADSPVLVCFEGGNPLYPMWIGGWWGNETAPFQMPVHATDDGGNPDNIFFTAPNGTTFQIDFRSGKEKILMLLPSGNFIRVGLDNETVMHSEKSNLIDAKELITVESPGKIVIKAKSVVVYSSGDTVVHAAGSASVRAGSQVNIDAPTINLNSGNAAQATGDDTKLESNRSEDGT